MLSGAQFMKRKRRFIMKKQKSLGNKGFSLVELIIVIAIMAILVGVLAPQLIKYVERSRQAKDRNAVDAVHTAIVTALLDPDLEGKVSTTGAASLSAYLGNSDMDAKGSSAILEILKATSAADIEGNFASKAYQGQSIVVAISNNNVTCTLAADTGKVADATPIVIK